MKRCAYCNKPVTDLAGAYRYDPDLRWHCWEHATIGAGFLQLDRFTRRFIVSAQNALALHGYALDRGLTTIISAGPDPAHMEVTVIKAAGWLQRAS